MARRYRYAIVKKKEAAKGKLSVGLASASLLLFVGAIGIAYALEGGYGFIVGGICLFAALLSVYGFLMGILSFSEENCMHRTSVVGAILNGVFMVGWLVFFLMGV
ncbi:hypothetical protein [Blautia sp. MSJ-19]|uniref:hypothetical protein n=1 Tax=Blautia sp. MSJ-19 TaxID=2841517 RepID=UPI001C0F10C1|nr:hypothetical protein [Blautia sp. MSJ-19]MBU5479917.1 hypothetical protein [Blautia sp. MSJ-19]